MDLSQVTRFAIWCSICSSAESVDCIEIEIEDKWVQFDACQSCLDKVGPNLEPAAGE